MVNTNRLRGKMAENGYTQDRLAEEMGMSKNTLSYKIRGITDFTISEVKKVCDILSITDMSEKEEIFLK